MVVFYFLDWICKVKTLHRVPSKSFIPYMIRYTLTDHLNKNYCTLADACIYSISQSAEKSRNLCRSRSRTIVNVCIRHQNGTNIQMYKKLSDWQGHEFCLGYSLIFNSFSALLSSDFCSPLTEMELDCNPFTSRFDILCILGWFSDYHSCKEWLPELLEPSCQLEPVWLLTSLCSNQRCSFPPAENILWYLGYSNNVKASLLKHRALPNTKCLMLHGHYKT